MGNLFAHLRANAIAYLALFVALGGSAYAAAKIDSRDVQNNSLKGTDVRNESLSRKDVKEQTLSGSVRVATDTQAEFVSLDDFGVTLLSTEIQAPRPGTLIANGALQFDGAEDGSSWPRCEIQHTPPGGGTSRLGTIYRTSVPASDAGEATMALSASTSVPRGTHTIDIECDLSSGGATEALGSLTVQFVGR